MQKSKAESENGLHGKEALLAAEPCREALQILKRFVLHIMCHSTLNTSWHCQSTTLPECVYDR